MKRNADYTKKIVMTHYNHSGETDAAKCSWLHPIWPPPKLPDRDGMICVVGKIFTKRALCKKNPEC